MCGIIVTVKNNKDFKKCGNRFGLKILWNAVGGCDWGGGLSDYFKGITKYNIVKNVQGLLCCHLLSLQNNINQGYKSINLSHTL